VAIFTNLQFGRKVFRTHFSLDLKRAFHPKTSSKNLSNKCVQNSLIWLPERTRVALF
jgi:hypothetical protein